MPYNYSSTTHVLVHGWAGSRKLRPVDHKSDAVTTTQPSTTTSTTPTTTTGNLHVDAQLAHMACFVDY